MSRRYGVAVRPSQRRDRDLLDGVLEGRGRDVVAFVRNHQPVTCSQLADIGAPGQRLQRDDINGPAELGPAAAELAGLDAEELADAGPPLVGQRLAVDQDERRCGMLRDQRAGDDCFPRPWRRDQDTLLMTARSVTASRCRPVKVPVKVNFCSVPADRSSVIQAAACFLRQRRDSVNQAPGQDQAAVDCLVEAVQEPGHVPGGGSHPLPLVEQRITHRGRVPKRSGQAWRQLGLLQPDPGREPRVDDRCGDRPRR